MEKGAPTVCVEEKVEAPIEEMLGSVTTYNCSEGSDNRSQQVRTSARVFKKLKLDSVLAAPQLPTERKELTSKEEKVEPNKKPLRPSWSPEDKSLFFEALNYYGKDFEAIHLYISNKNKRKGIPDCALKTKDQVRHFYYRTWHKISKHLKFSEGIKKLAQELYGLINYGELRRKIGSVSEKIRMKLNELMYRGSIAIRCRGKTVRVKTPLCRALRRLNQFDEKQEEPKLPTRILVEVVPRNINSWLQVQSTAQNPRVKALLPLQKRLSFLIEYLNSRWKSPITGAYEKIVSSLTKTDIRHGDTENVDDSTSLPSLRLYPPPVSDLRIPTINLGEYLTSHSICLSAYEEKLGITPCEDQPKNIRGSVKSRGTKRCRNDSLTEKNSSNKFNSLSSGETNELGILTDVREIIDEAIHTMLALQKQNSKFKDEKNDCEDTLIEANDNKCDNKSKVQEEPENNEKKELVNCQLGWTLDCCGTLTIGELYLKFGTGSKLLLEYDWGSAPCTEELKGNERNEQQKLADGSERLQEDITSALHKLLSIAKFHFASKDVCKCSCGHYCNGSMEKTSISKNKTPVMKNSKSTHPEQKINGHLELNQIKEDHSPSSVSDSLESPNSLNQVQTNVFKHPRAFGIESLSNAHLDHLRPKYFNRKNRRPRNNKVLVVERRLPLLANKNLSSHQIVQMNIIPQDMPAIPSVTNVIQMEAVLSSGANASEIDIKNVSGNQNGTSMDSGEVAKSRKEGTASELLDHTIISNRLRPSESISDLLEFPSIISNGKEAAEQSQNSSTSSFAGLLPNSTPPASPSCILKENENQWITAEVADFSLSSFLGHLESPAKQDLATPSNSATDESRLCQDVDVHLQSLFCENSVDYMAKFADLAAEVESNKK